MAGQIGDGDCYPEYAQYAKSCPLEPTCLGLVGQACSRNSGIQFGRGSLCGVNHGTNSPLQVLNKTGEVVRHGQMVQVETRACGCRRNGSVSRRQRCAGASEKTVRNQCARASSEVLFDQMRLRIHERGVILTSSDEPVEYHQHLIM